MYEHSAIKTVVGDEEERNTAREAVIEAKPEIINQVTTMLNAINTEMTTAGRSQAASLEVAQTHVATFMEFKTALAVGEQVALDRYNIHRPLLGSGHQNMRFEIAIGGNDGCIITTQLSLWQFVRHFRAEAVIPARVMELANLPHQRFDLGQAQPSNEPVQSVGLSVGLSFAQLLRLQTLAQLGPVFEFSSFEPRIFRSGDDSGGPGNGPSGSPPAGP
jgi:hypothetical protein